MRDMRPNWGTSLLKPGSVSYSIIPVVVCIVAGALVVQYNLTKAATNVSSATSSDNGTNLCVQGASGCPTSSPYSFATTPANMPPTTSTPATKGSAASSSGAGLGNSGSAVYDPTAFNAQMAEYNRCNDANNAAGKKYSAAIDQAQAAYDAVMAQWNAVKDQSAATHNPYTEYAAQAKLNYNAISVPAYVEYTSTLSMLKTQGCQVVQVYTDTSWK